MNNKKTFYGWTIRKGSLIAVDKLEVIFDMRIRDVLEFGFGSLRYMVRRDLVKAIKKASGE